MDSTLLTPNDGAQKPQRSNHEDIQLHWFRRRSSLCTRAVVESIRTGQVCVLKDTLAAIGKKARTDELDEYGFALLHHAARSDSTEALRALLDCGANIDVRDLEDGLTPLHVAARFNSVQALEYLLESGASVGLVDSHQNTALHHSVRRRHLDIVRILLEDEKSRAIDINSTNRSGMTALHLACTHGDVEICDFLLEHAADIRLRSADGMTPLHSAVFSSSTEAAGKILSKALALGYDSSEFVNEQDLDKSTALHLAAETGSKRSVEICLEHGADINYRRANDMTPLHIAAMKGDVEIAELLFSQGADIEAKDGEFMTALHRAAALNKVQMITFLLSKGANLEGLAMKRRTPFLTAVAMGKTQGAMHLVNAGACVSALDSSLKNCLHLAVENGRLEMVERLLKCESMRENLFKPDADERVALHYAAMGKDLKILELLLTKYTRITYQDDHHKSPLHYAAQNGRAAHVEALGCIATKVNERDDQGLTPLHHAAMRRHRKVCFALEQLGADVDCKENNRWTPLMLAAKDGCPRTCEGLLDRQASMDLVNSDGDTALHIASQHKQVGVVELLFDRGARLTVVNKVGQTFLGVALKSGALDVAVVAAKHRRWKEIMEYKNHQGHTPMKALIQHCPEAAGIVMGRCIASSYASTDPEHTVSYDFHLLDPGPDDETALKGDRFFGPTTMVTYGRESLLLHPLTTKLLDIKWKYFGKHVYYFNLVTYLVFLISYTLFIVSERAAQTFTVRSNSTVQANAVNAPLQQSVGSTSAVQGNGIKASDIFERRTQLNSVVLTIALVFASGHMLKEVIQMFLQGRRYFCDPTNLTDWALYICTFTFTLPYMLTPTELDETLGTMKNPRNIWLFGVVSIFLCYLNLLLFLRRFQRFGIYVAMFVEVSKTIGKFMVIFSVLILAFAIVFHILFKEQAAFDTFGMSIAKVAVMLIGEFDYVSTFVDTVQAVDDKGHLLNVFPEAALVILVIFILFMAIVLMNLLIGLAVGDINTVQRNANLRRLAMQVAFNAEVERKFPKFITRMVYKPVLVVKPNIIKHRLQGVLRILFGIKSHSADSTSMIGQQTSNDVTNSDLREQLSKTKKRVKSLVCVVQAQNKLLRGLSRKFSHLPDAEDAESGDEWLADDQTRPEIVGDTVERTVEEREECESTNF